MKQHHAFVITVAKCGLCVNKWDCVADNTWWDILPPPPCAQFMSPATFSTAEAVGVAGATWGKKLKEQLPGGRAAAAAREAASGPGGRKPLPAKVCTSITDGLKAIYFQKVRGGRAGEGAASGLGGRKPLPA